MSGFPNESERRRLTDARREKEEKRRVAERENLPARRSGPRGCDAVEFYNARSV